MPAAAPVSLMTGSPAGSFEMFQFPALSALANDHVQGCTCNLQLPSLKKTTAKKKQGNTSVSEVSQKGPLFLGSQYVGNFWGGNYRDQSFGAVRMQL